MVSSLPSVSLSSSVHCGSIVVAYLPRVILDFTMQLIKEENLRLVGVRLLCPGIVTYLPVHYCFYEHK